MSTSPTQRAAAGARTPADTHGEGAPRNRAERRAGRRLDPLPAPLAVPPAEARRLLGLGNTTLYGLIRGGRLRTVKLGRRRLVLYASIEELLAPQD